MVACIMEAQLEYMHIALDFFFFARLGGDLHAQSGLISKISASELRGKFIKSALLVGYRHKINSCVDMLCTQYFYLSMFSLASASALGSPCRVQWRKYPQKYACGGGGGVQRDPTGHLSSQA